MMILQGSLQAGIQTDQIYGPKSNRSLWSRRQVQPQAGAVGRGGPHGGYGGRPGMDHGAEAVHLPQ